MAHKPPKKLAGSLKILFADDELNLQELMRNELPRMGHRVTVCPDGRTAITALQEDTFDVVLVDWDMPGANGLEVIAKAKELVPDAFRVILTGKGTVDTAVAALREGAFDFLKKPCKLVEIDALLTRIVEHRELTRRCQALEHQVRHLERGARLIGSSPQMDEVRELIRRVAPTTSTVLIRGETGTGKELVARSVHDLSTRCDAPFVAVNCGALPENLIESELFGHRKGSFTGASDNRVGLFEVASGGTLFLDEIGELPKSLQAKLLRVLESGEIRRVGENEAVTVDVRLVCATHRNLDQMVAAGEFRQDLVYRINTFEILLPALRDRIGDIRELAEHLLKRFRPNQGPPSELIQEDAIELLVSHVWPGNVRELANVLEHAIILSDDGPITAADLPPHFMDHRLVGDATSNPGPETLRETEQRAIQDALERTGGNKSRAAEQLGISLKTLYNKLAAAEALEKSA